VYKKILALVLGASLLAACAGGQGGGTPAAGGETRDNVIINLTADISILDPHGTSSSPDFRLIDQIYTRLVDRTEHGFEGALAESWELAPDGLSYTFNLRSGVVFHNGQPFTARDVVFSFERAQQSPFTAANLTAMAGVVALDDYTVRIDLLHPFAPFLSSIQMIWIISEQVYNAEGEAFGRHPIGTGPYMFVEHVPGQSVQLTRFDYYYGEPAYIRDVSFMVILNPATTSIAVEAGDIDVAIAAPVEDLNRLGDLSNLSKRPFDTLSINFISLNVDVPILSNQLVRQAISHAIDRESFVIMVADGFGSPARGFINELTFGYSPNITQFPFDPERGRELLAEAGYPDGFNIRIGTIGGAFESQAQVLQSQLAAIGITAGIDLSEQSAFLGDLFSSNYEIAVLSITLTEDADIWSTVLTTDGGMNMTGFGSPEIDRLFEEGRVSTDANERVEIYRQIAQLVNDYSAFIPVFFTSTAIIHDANITMPWVGSGGGFRVASLRWN